MIDEEDEVDMTGGGQDERWTRREVDKTRGGQNER